MFFLVTQDFYSVLGVSKGASKADIKSGQFEYLYEFVFFA